MFSFFFLIFLPIKLDSFFWLSFFPRNILISNMTINILFFLELILFFYTSFDIFSWIMFKTMSNCLLLCLLTDISFVLTVIFRNGFCYYWQELIVFFYRVHWVFCFTRNVKIPTFIFKCYDYDFFIGIESTIDVFQNKVVGQFHPRRHKNHAISSRRI